MDKIKVLIVDDSSVIRKLLEKILSMDPIFEIVGTATDPYIAREKLVKLKPDVMTLDVEMPRMDGLTFLEAVMKHMPTRTVIISSLTAERSPLALRALELGAIDVLQKPSLDVIDSMNKIGPEICERVQSAALARLISAKSYQLADKPISRKQSLESTTHQIVAIASSTGGTEALKVVLTELPSDLPGIVIAQHMPPGFTKVYAESLNKICHYEVREAKHGDKVLPGLALVAPGNFHMEVKRSGGCYIVQLHQEPLMHGVRPAADYLMKSVAREAGANAMGIVLTGMGRDGAQGLLEMKNAGAFTIAQDERSCVVYGMPKEAFKLNATCAVLPLDQISRDLESHFRKKNVA